MLLTLSLLIWCSLIITSSSIHFESDNAPAIFNTVDWIPLESKDSEGDNIEKLRPTPPVSNSWNDPLAEIFVGNNLGCCCHYNHYSYWPTLTYWHYCNVHLINDTEHFYIRYCALSRCSVFQNHRKHIPES